MRIARLLLTLSLASIAALLLPSAGSAATDIGRTAATGESLADCTADTGHVTTTATGTNPYIAPVSGVITEWRFRADVNPGTIALQVLNQPDPMNNNEFQPVLETPPAAMVAGQLNKVQARLPITAGQFIGLRAATASHGCYASGATLTDFTDHGGGPPAPLPAGGTQMYGNAQGTSAANIAATIEPDGDNDGFGDETQDGCPKNAGRSDDCIAPSVKIDKGPKKKIKKPKATFEFSSDDKTATFECSVDDKKFAACASPLKVKKLKKGKHTFEVRAVDKNNNTSDEADYKWKVKPKKK